MANIISVGTGGNFTTAATWQTVATGGSGGSAVELDSISGNTAISTSVLDSTAFVPPNSAVDAICFKLAARATSPSGTFTISFRNSTSPGTRDFSVTVNVSDLPAATTANNSQGIWLTFKAGSSVTPNGTDSYVIRCVCSATGSQVTGMTNGTANNWCRKVRTTTTQAPASGNHIVVCNEYTGAGTGNTCTITHDNTATTSFGPTVSGGPPDGIHLSAGATWNWGTTASTAYYFKWKGIWTISGTLTVASSGSRMPTSSSATFFMDSAADRDTQFLVQALGSATFYGASKTAYTQLTADKSATNTVIALADTTGWQNGDTVMFSATGTTISQFEKKVISSVDSSTQITLTAGLTNAHSGTGIIAGYCANMTRNIVFTGASTSLRGRMRLVAAGGNWYFDNCEFTIDKLSDTTNNSCAIFLASTTNSATFTGCSFNSSTTNGGGGAFVVSIDNAAVDNFTFNNCVASDWNNDHWYISQASSGVNWSITNCLGIGSASRSFELFDCGGTFTGNIALNCTNEGFMLREANSLDLTNTSNWTGLIAKSCSTHGMQIFATASIGHVWYFKNLTFVRCAGSGVYINSRIRKILIDTMTNVGCAQGNTPNNAGIRVAQTNTGSEGGVIIGYNWTMAGDTTATSYYGITDHDNTYGGMIDFYLFDCTFGVSSGINNGFAGADVIINDPSHTRMRIFADNCKFSSTTNFSGLTSALQQNFGDHLEPAGSFVRCNKFGQVANDHRTYVPQGTITRETTRVHTASQSAKATPNTASYKLRVGPFRCTVSSGVSRTVSIYTYKSKAASGDSADYNGAQPRLVVRKNATVGISTDTVVATGTSSIGNWESLSGVAVASPSADGVIELYVDCDGTTGFICVAEASVS